jgi:hypothetical protein
MDVNLVNAQPRPRFGRIPERGLTDTRLWRTRHAMHARVLYACAIHADAAGMFCVSQNTIANLVGLKHGASAHSYMKDLEDWRYLRRIGKIKHPARKLLGAASKAGVKLDDAISPLSDLIVRQMIIRPGEDERDNAANIPARRRLDDDCVASSKKMRGKAPITHSPKIAAPREMKAGRDDGDTYISQTDFKIF